jgi:hypothetical protein
VTFKDLQKLREIKQRATESVDLVDHHAIDLARFDVGDQASQSGAVHVSAGKSPVVVILRQTLPTLVGLAFDVCLPGLSLSIQGVEFLFETIFGGLSSVDCTSKALDRRHLAAVLGFVHLLPPELLSLKK